MLTELSTEIIDSMLVNQRYGRLACAADDRILVEPMMYYYDGNAIWGLTREGTKTQLLRKNPRVAFEIDEILRPGVWRSVVIEGIFEELHDDDRDYALYLLKHHKIPVFADEKLGYPGEIAPPDFKVVYPVVYRIQIKQKTGRAYTHQLFDN
ncbi:pyridoxamine 5'-phosphate oxidase family protein [Larkinella sp. VNQ87]|uniref:pyridoxamine 5'-phosphate oxidase family protein n=1 Tax=Larkinella sp. VNQ87 TaxID=3400921 RepID=UPI003C047F1F